MSNQSDTPEMECVIKRDKSGMLGILSAPPIFLCARESIEDMITRHNEMLRQRDEAIRERDAADERRKQIAAECLEMDRNANLRVSRAKTQAVEAMEWLGKSRKEASVFRNLVQDNQWPKHRFSWEEPEPEQPRHLSHSPACQLGDKCQCEEPEMVMSRQDIEDARGDYEYQLMIDRQAEDE